MNAEVKQQGLQAEVRGGLTAYLQVDGAAKASDFYQRAFGATEAVSDGPVPDVPIRTAFDPVSARFMMVFCPTTDCFHRPLALATRTAP